MSNCYMDITTANPSLVTSYVNSSGVSEVTVTYDAYIKSNVAKSSGKWYLEIYIGSNVMNIGICKSTYSTATQRTGAYTNFDYSRPRVMSTSTGRYHDGRGTVNGGFVYHTAAVPVGTAVGLYLDYDNNKLRYFLNGVALDELDIIDRAEGEEFTISISGGNPSAVSMQTCTVNFGQQPFKFQPKEVPLDARAYDDSRFAIEDETYAFLEGNGAKYVTKKGIVELMPPLRAINTLDSMFKAKSDTEYQVGSDGTLLDKSYAGTLSVYNLFDHYNVDPDCWISANGVRKGTITVDFGKRTALSGIRLIPRYVNNTSYGQGAMPTAFKVYGSNDGNTWTNLHEVTGSASWAYTTVRDFLFTETFFYRYYQFYFYNTQNASSQYMAIGNLIFLQDKLELVEFDYSNLEPIEKLRLEEVDSIADQITSKLKIVGEEDMDGSNKFTWGSPTGIRSLQLMGGNKIYE